MNLVRFSEKVGTKAALTISAKDLDDNFSRLKPIQQSGNARHYLLTETPDGWSMRIFPEFPSGTETYFLAFDGAGLYWVTMSGKASSDDGGSTDGNEGDDQSFTELQMQEVERCDGKKMRVLATDWYDSDDGRPLKFKAKIFGKETYIEVERG